MKLMRSERMGCCRGPSATERWFSVVSYGILFFPPHSVCFETERRRKSAVCGGKGKQYFGTEFWGLAKKNLFSLPPPLVGRQVFEGPFRLPPSAGSNFCKAVKRCQQGKPLKDCEYKHTRRRKKSCGSKTKKKKKQW